MNEFDDEFNQWLVTALGRGPAKLSPRQPPLARPENLLGTHLGLVLGRRLKPEETRYVKQVQSLHTQCGFSGRVTTWQLQPFSHVSGTTWETVEFWPTFPDDEVEFWHFLAAGLRSRGCIVPAFMEVLVPSPELKQRIDQFHRQREIAAWQRRLAELRPAPATAPTGPIDLRLILTPEKGFVEWKKPDDSAFRALNTNNLRQLTAAQQTNNLWLSSDAHLVWNALFPPWEQSLLHFDYGNQVFVHAVNRLLRLTAANHVVLTQEGQPFARRAEPLRWDMRPPEAEDGDYCLSLLQADGQPAPRLFLRLPGYPTLYLSADTVFSGPPPQLGFLDPSQPNRIPAPAVETNSGMHLFQHLDVPIPERLAARIVKVSFRVKVKCDLKRRYADAPTEDVVIRVEAQSSAGNQREMLRGEAWMPLGTDKLPSKSPARQLYQFDRTILQHFPGLLVSLGAKWNHFHDHWGLRVTRTLPAKLVEWLSTLPNGIEVQLDPALATLTRDPISASVHLECTETDIDWFDLKVAVTTSDSELSPEELKLLLDAKGGYVRLGKKGWRRLEFNISQDDDERLARLGLSPKDFTSEPQKLHALQLADTAATHLLPSQQVEQIQRRVAELKMRVTPAVPQTIRAELRPYQVEGFHFLAYLAMNRFGGILADDMGLGKTLQALTWLAWLREQPEFKSQPSLVVCPKSVMDNWRAEAERFLPTLRVHLWQGTDPADLENAREKADLLVLNYSQLRALGVPLASLAWHVAILDEGQYIKNPQSQTARAAVALRAQHRLVLSGTPIENQLLDLWSLMTFAMPGVLGNRTQFIKRFSSADDPLARRRLTSRVRPFLLRRTKTQVARDLPDRIEEDVICELEGEQKLLYQAELKRARQILLGIETQQQLNEQRFHFLTSLLRLRQICCHPCLVNTDLRKAESAKLEALSELLEPLMAEGHKVLVFSQFVTMLELLRDLVETKSWPYFYLAGDTENRGDLVRSFQAAEGAAVFLISLKAGGFGLNLTAASYVVLYDPWWNPAVENQAIDRTHRIGQTSKVMAYRLLIKNSIEEKIRNLQRQKSALALDVLGEESFTQNLTVEDLRFLFAE